MCNLSEPTFRVVGWLNAGKQQAGRQAGKKATLTERQAGTDERVVKAIRDQRKETHVHTCNMHTANGAK
jgi:hypothetical protein